MTIEAYPLCWPIGWPRREPYRRESSPYKVQFATARDELVRTVRENVRGIGYAVAALRMLERCGSGEVLDRAYAGFALLPESAGAGDHWTTLGLRREGASGEDVRRRYRELAKTHHPDAGGNAATFAAITEAYTRALAEVGA